ncbi:MAG: molybdenum cofactor guanylyltransferase [Bacteroidetes bacterium]|nr:MAG: molybdenum cofactor guanylyltransferase [Bacteroidota bacterium]
MNKANITGVILAGGKNSRMGSDKGMLLIEGKKIVERTIDILKPLVNEIIIISNGKNYEYLGYRVYNDIIKDRGPMGGIHTALSYTKTDKMLVISCDMPFVSEKALSVLVNESNEGEIVIPEHDDGKLEPLCAVYSISCNNKFEKLLRSCNWRMKDSLGFFNVHRIYFSGDELPKQWFMNVNTPAEYQSILQASHEYSG